MSTTLARSMTEEAYRAFAASEAGKLVELWDGEPRQKPGMSVEHSGVIGTLGFLLQDQLGWDRYRVRWNIARLRIAPDRYFIPDIAVVPLAAERALRARPGTLDAYDRPLPLVVEVWSPSTGGYDIDEKLAASQRRGHEEIWYLHPYERTLIAWRQQADGSYGRAIYREGFVRPATLAGVEIDLAVVFDG